MRTRVRFRVPPPENEKGLQSCRPFSFVPSMNQLPVTMNALFDQQAKLFRQKYRTSSQSLCSILT
jgi:hypothetical protein